MRDRGAAAVDAPLQADVRAAASQQQQPVLMQHPSRSASSFKGMEVHDWYPHWLKATCFKLQDALIDFAYCPQYNAVRRVIEQRQCRSV